MSENKKQLSINPKDMEKIVEDRYQRYVTELLDAHKAKALLTIDRREMTAQSQPFGSDIITTLPVIAFTFTIDENKLTEYRKKKLE